MQLAMAPPSRNAKSFLKVEMVIRYTPNGFPYREPPTPKEKRTTSTGVWGRGPVTAVHRPAPQPSPKKSEAQPPGKPERRASPVARFWTSSVSRICGLSPARATGSSSTRDIKAGIYDTRSIYAMRLSDLSFGRGGARLRRLRQHQVEVKLRTTAIAADLLAATAAQANDYSLVIACYNSTISVESALDSYNRCLGSINGCSRQWRVLSWAHGRSS